MKTWLVSGLLAFALMPAQGQLFSNDSVGGALLGGLVGGIIGHNTGGHTAEGVGIGAGAGFLLGTLTHQARLRSSYPYYPPPPAYPPPFAGYPCETPPIGVSVYYSAGFPPDSDWDAWGGYDDPPYAYRCAPPDAALSGAVVGGVVGGVIGHNSGGHTAEGVSIGAGTGFVLGSLAEQTRAPVDPPPRPVARSFSHPKSVAARSKVSIPNAPTVPDAPRVGEAPRF